MPSTHPESAAHGVSFPDLDAPSAEDTRQGQSDSLSTKASVDAPAFKPTADMPSSRNFEEFAPWYSRLFIAWMFVPLLMGRKKQLNRSDLGPPLPQDDPKGRSETLFAAFKETGSLRSALWRLIGPRNFYIALVLSFFQAGFNMAVPYLTKLLLLSLAGTGNLSTGGKVGITFAVSLLPLFAAMCQAHVLLISRRAALHMYTSLTALIFDKSLRLSPAAGVATGRITTMMANDAGVSMERSIQMVFPLIVAPPQLTLLLWLLYRELGTALFAGIGVVVVAIPLAVFVFANIQRKYTAVMHLADHRQKLVNEFLSAVRVIKAYAWEDPLMDEVRAGRKQETRMIRRHAYWITLGLSLVFLQLPNVLQVVVLWYAVLGGSFLPSIIFPALQLFAQVGAPLAQLPNAVSQTAQTLTAIRRIDEYLKEPEMIAGPNDDRATAARPNPGEVCLAFRDAAAFTWGKTAAEKSMLSKLDCELVVGELVALIGPVGAGKSSFLLAALGEMMPVRGSVLLHGRVALAAQEAWLFSGTLRENILFGSAFEEDRYWATIEACALARDLEILKGGDQVIIGEKGITVSGGQKARIALARAVYARTEILLLDDPLAAVDTHVGDHIFETLTSSELVAGRLVVLVTSQMSRLKLVDRVVLLSKDGELLGSDTLDRLVSAGHDLKSFVAEQAEGDAVPTEEQVEESRAKMARQRTDGALLAKSQSSKRVVADDLFEEEKRQTGQMSLNVFKSYARAAGATLVFWCILVNVSYLLLPSVGQILITQLTDESLCETYSTRAPGCTNTTVMHGNTYWLGWYSFTIGLSILMCGVGGALAAEVRTRAATRLFEVLLTPIAHATTGFFDVTPLGRITARFGRDMGLIDTLLSQMFYWTVCTAGIVLGGVFLVIYSTSGVFLAALLPVVFLLVQMFVFQRSAGVDFLRIEGTTRAPVYSLFGEVLQGRSTIRAFKQETRLMARNIDLIRENAVPFFLGRAALSAWLVCWLNIIGTIATTAVAFFVIFSSGIVSPGDAGLALTSTSAITGTFFVFIFVSQDFEIQLQSVERIQHFSGLIECEAPSHVPEKDPAAPWPAQGGIEVQALSLGYRDGPDILMDVSFSVKPREKLGVVGRTGSGKSTLMLALLRIVEARRGKILIDGVDIAGIGLTALRDRVGIVPQNPVMFIGTLRYNLDPFVVHTDEEIWEALTKCQMRDFCQGLDLKLAFVVAEGGENLSVGQRQLLCVARALLRNTPILLLDEASASLDMTSDEVLQKMLRTAFAASTTITIAHRLDTIADADRVLVMDHGRVMEFDAPFTLLQNEHGLFRDMCEKSNAADKIRAVALEAFEREKALKQE